MSIEYKVIGRHIRTARDQKHMTQEAVAEAIDMSCAHFGKVERGERPVNLQRLSQLSTLLEIPLEALVEGAVFTERDVALPSMPHNHSEFIDAVNNIAKGCSESSLRLMIRLCAAVAEEDKSGKPV